MYYILDRDFVAQQKARDGMLCIAQCRPDAACRNRRLQGLNCRPHPRVAVRVCNLRSALSPPSCGSRGHERFGAAVFAGEGRKVDEGAAARLVGLHATLPSVRTRSDGRRRYTCQFLLFFFEEILLCGCKGRNACVFDALEPKFGITPNRSSVVFA